VIWKADDLQIAAELPLLVNGAVQVAWTADSQYLAALCGDKTVRVWKAPDWHAVGQLAMPGVTYQIVPAGQNATLVIVNSDLGEVVIWDFLTNLTDTLAGYTTLVNAIAWSPDGKRLASSAARNRIQFWSTAAGQAEKLVGYQDNDGWPGNDTVYAPGVLAWSSDGEQLAVAMSDGTVQVWNTQTYAPTQQVKTGVYDITSLSWGAENQTITWTETDPVSSEVKQVLSQLQIDVKGIRRQAIALNPDKTVLAVATPGYAIQLWNIGTKQLIASLEGHTGDITMLAWSPDGTCLASSSLDGTVWLWGSKYR
jgi:WD40 repeat protein